MDAQLCVKKEIGQFNGTRILPGKCQSTFLTVHSNNNYLAIYIYDFLVLFYLH